MSFVPDDPWDVVRFDDKPVPAPCRVSRLSSVRYVVSVDCYEANWGAVQDYLSELQPESLAARRVDHPTFQLMRVDQVRVLAVEPAQDDFDVLGNRIRVVTIVVEEAS